jgi:predicted RNase H-like nuclease (RuvC/YqgF family)
MSANYANETNHTYDPSVNFTPLGKNEVQRLPQVTESFEVLEKSIEALKENCINLEKRLDVALRHEPEATGSAQKEVSPTVVTLAQRINDSSNKIHTLNNQLNSILRRLEL